MDRNGALDEVLTRLARETDEAMSGPGPDMVALVMADAALTALSREAALTAPRPSHDLVARVLAEAAEVGASRTAAARSPAARPATRRRLGAAGARGGLLDLLLGWRAGAIAAMGLALALGAGVGFEMEPGSLPILDNDVQQAAPLNLALLDSDMLDVDGL